MLFLTFAFAFFSFSIASLIIDNIVLVSRALRHQFIIPDFEGFTAYIDQFYDNVKDVDEGKVRGFLDFVDNADNT